MASDRRWILTYTGRQVNPFEPVPGDFDIRDIAHALSLQARYGGHTMRHYSVAEHCVRVSRAAQALAEWREYAPADVLLCAKWGLIHDASEAYLTDLPRPVKLHPGFGFYRAAEEDLLTAIANWLDLPADSVVGDLVDAVDKTMPRIEGPALFAPGTLDAWTTTCPALEIPFAPIYAPLSATEAEDAFLARFVGCWPDKWHAAYACNPYKEAL